MGRYTNCWNEGSGERRVPMARERRPQKSPASCPLILVRQPTFLASPSQTPSLFLFHDPWGFGQKGRKGEKQAADFALLWILAARSEPAPLQLYSLPRKRGAQSFSVPGGAFRGVDSCPLLYSSSCPEEVFGNSLSLPGYDRL